MHISYMTCWLPKQGSREDEYEDAFSPFHFNGERVPEFLCALADGATETSFSGLWAQILVDAYVNKHLRRLDTASIVTLSEQWREAIAEKTRAKPLPWYAEEKLRLGAYSSLLGLHVSAGGRWSAVSIGDTCLFHLRPHRWLSAFPYTRAEQFNSHPALLSTHADGLDGVKAVVQRGFWKEGDTFLLMTDALAHCFIAHPHHRMRIADPDLDQDAFTRLVEAMRQGKLCRNDDMTLVRINPTLGAPRSGMA